MGYETFLLATTRAGTMNVLMFLLTVLTFAIEFILLPVTLILIIVWLGSMRASQNRQEARQAIDLVDQMILSNSFPRADIRYLSSSALSQFWWSRIFINSPVDKLVVEIREAQTNESNQEMPVLLKQLRGHLINAF